MYRVIGTGKPVILIHGFGEDGTIWNHQVEYLKNNFKLIVPDLPGSGQSEMIDDMSMEGMAEVVKTIIDLECSLPSKVRFSGFENKKVVSKLSGSKAPPSEGFGEAIVIGHSMGGYITLALVEKYFNHVSAFGLFHSSAFADSEEKIATRRKGIAFIKEHGAFEFLKTVTPNLFSPATRENRAKIIEKQVAALSSFSKEALVSYYQAMIQRPDRTHILKEATVPVLFAMGKYDNAIPLADGLKQCHLPEKSYIHILQNSGHMGMLEETEKTNLLLEIFLHQK